MLRLIGTGMFDGKYLGGPSIHAFNYRWLDNAWSHVPRFSSLQLTYIARCNLLAGQLCFTSTCALVHHLHICQHCFYNPWAICQGQSMVYWLLCHSLCCTHVLPFPPAQILHVGIANSCLAHLFNTLNTNGPITPLRPPHVPLGLAFSHLGHPWAHSGNPCLGTWPWLTLGQVGPILVAFGWPCATSPWRLRFGVLAYGQSVLAHTWLAQRWLAPF